MRTHAIVSVSACLLMILSKYAFSDTGDYDSSRIAASVIAGIGFLGAAIITYRRDALHGSTTAAGILSTAAIGMAIGSGMYITGCFTAFMLFLIQYALRVNRYVIRKSGKCLIKITVDLSGNNNLGIIKKMLNISTITRLRTKKNKTIGYIDAFLRVYLTDEKIVEIMNSTDLIHSMEMIEEYSQQ